MVAFGHTAVGVIVGVTAYNYFGQSNSINGLVATGALGVVSHYIADFIPHGHFFKPDKFHKYIMPVIIFDLLIPIVVFLGITYFKDGFSGKLLYIMFGIGGSQLPDVIAGLGLAGFIKAKGPLKIEERFHEGLHWHGSGSDALLLGLIDIWQALMILIAFLLVVF